MPLSLMIIARPGRAAALAAAAGAVFFAHGAVALGWPQPDRGWDGLGYLGGVLLAAGLLVAVLALGLLAPLRGRRGRAGLILGRVGLALLAVAVLLSLALETMMLDALQITGLLVALLGVRLLTRARQKEGDLPAWAYSSVAAGLVAAVVAAGVGGALLTGLVWLAIAAAIHTAHATYASLSPRAA